MVRDYLSEARESHEEIALLLAATDLAIARIRRNTRILGALGVGLLVFGALYLAAIVTLGLRP